MNFLSIFLTLIILACLLVIFAIVFKKFVKVAAVNLATAPQLKQTEVKRKLMEIRLQRKVGNLANFLLKVLKPAGSFLSSQLKILYQKIVDLEEEYRHKVLKSSFQDKVQLQHYVAKMLAEAQYLAESGKDAEAERKYIEVLKLDGKNISAYRGLGDLYLSQKNYGQAKETFEFLIKLNANDPNILRKLGKADFGKGDLKKAQEQYLKSLELDSADIGAYLDLADVYLHLEDAHGAFKAINQALALDPNNPRVLDFLIEVSIIVRDKAAAYKAYKQLKEVNPDNQKLEEFKDKIEKL